jgi:thioredoxin-related protein
VAGAGGGSAGAVAGRVAGDAAADKAAGEFFMQSFGDLKGELAVARKANLKGVVLIFEMDGCPFCERLKRVALQSSAVRQYYHANFLVYRIDIKGASALTGFDGVESTESAFAARQGVKGTPTIVFYGLNGSEMTRLVGPPTDAPEFLLLGRYAADGHYKSGPFAAFRQAQRQVGS